MDSPTGSSFTNVFHSIGRQHEKPLKQAFYNTAALLFLLASAVVAVSAYYVLEAFLRPLIWAALCGTFLFPFKKASTKVVREWLSELKSQGKPFTVGVVLLPLTLASTFLHRLENVARSNKKMLLGVVVMAVLFYGLLIYHPFYQIFYVIEIVVTTLMKMIACFNNPMVVWSTVVAYIVILLFWSKIGGESYIVLQLFSIAIWTIMVFHLISLTGSWKIPTLMVVIALMVMGAVVQKKDERTDAKSENVPSTMNRKLSVKFVIDNTLNIFGINTKSKLAASDSSTSLTSLSASTLSVSSVEYTESAGEVMSDIQKYTDAIEEENEVTEETVSEIQSNTNIVETKINETEDINKAQTLPVNKAQTLPVNKAQTLAGINTETPTSTKPKYQRSTSASRVKKTRKKGRSDPYFIALLWLFAISFFWTHLSIFCIFMLLIPVKYLLQFIVSTDVISSQLASISNHLHQFHVEREQMIFPPPVKKVLSLLHLGDQKWICLLSASIDKIMSLMIILCLVMLVSLGTAFFALQVQHESSYLVTVATNVVNETIVSNKEYLEWLNLNDSNIRTTFDTTIHSGYMAARGKMAEYISSVITSHDSNSTYMENQITQVMDQLYEAWVGQKTSMKRPIYASKNNSLASPADTNNVLMAAWCRFKRLANTSDYGKIFEVFKENLHTLYSVLESIWLIVKGNMNLMLSIITTIISTVFFSGTYLLNVLISSIIFATTLFYLLNSSAEEYKLLELFSVVCMGTKFGESITNAIQDVFGASLKMAAFYFVFTWLTHDGFGANLIFIPAVLAAMLAVVPFIGTYWAAVPAALELWLIQKKGVLSLFLITLHFLPTYVVDTAIYSEIGEGGHPYLTGLAVAGGVYCFGLEGAFFGPFVLCCLIAAFDIYNTIMNSQSTDNCQHRDRSMTSPIKPRLMRSSSEIAM